MTSSGATQPTKTRFSPHFVREKKKRNQSNAFPGPSPNPYPNPNFFPQPFGQQATSVESLTLQPTDGFTNTVRKSRVATNYVLRLDLCEQILYRLAVPQRLTLASYPGHVGEGKSGLVSTVCACANDSGNFSPTSPIMDKLHVWLLCGEITKPDIRLRVWQLCLLGDGFHYQRHKRLHDKDYATTTAVLPSLCL